MRFDFLSILDSDRHPPRGVHIEQPIPFQRKAFSAVFASVCVFGVYEGTDQCINNCQNNNDPKKDVNPCIINETRGNKYDSQTDLEKCQ